MYLKLFLQQNTNDMGMTLRNSHIYDKFCAWPEKKKEWKKKVVLLLLNKIIWSLKNDMKW